MKAARIDWNDVKRRMAAADEIIARAWEPDEAEVTRRLKMRADLLARENEPEQATADSIDVVELMLDKARYAVESRYVRDIYPAEHITPIPCTPDFVLGIVNLRGEILSVIDIMKFIGIPLRESIDLNRLIVLERGDMRFGILAGAVVGTRAVRKADIHSHLPVSAETDHVQGIADGLLVLLDASELMQDPRLIVKEET